MNGIKKILLLEDDEFTRLMVQTQLEQVGFSVEAFSNYTDISAALKEKKCDLIITDLQVGDIDPANLVKNIKAIKAVPVVVLSSAKYQVKDADLTLEKPLDSEKIDQIGEIFKKEVDLDLSKVYQFACGDEELLATYLNTFIYNLIEDLQALKDEVSMGDVKAIQNRAHKMLSSITYYGHKSINHLLQKIELQAEDLSATEMSDLINDLELLATGMISQLQQKIPA